MLGQNRRQKTNQPRNDDKRKHQKMERSQNRFARNFLGGQRNIKELEALLICRSCSFWQMFTARSHPTSVMKRCWRLTSACSAGCSQAAGLTWLQAPVGMGPA